MILARLAACLVCISLALGAWMELLADGQITLRDEIPMSASSTGVLLGLLTLAAIGAIAGLIH